jgi:hypothetical protein
VIGFAIREALPELPLLAAVDVGVLGAAGWRYWEPVAVRGIGTVTGFDPDPAACARFNAEATPGITYHPALVADGNPVRLHRTSDPRHASPFEPDAHFAAAFEGLVAACRVERIDPLPSIRPADATVIESAGCDFLRVDVRGAEAVVLANAGRHLDTAAVVHTSVPMGPLYRGAPAFDRVDAVMAARGFIVHCFLAGCWAKLAADPGAPASATGPLREQPLWSEVVYVKDYTDPRTQSVAVWHSLAIAAHELYEAPDLAHRALANADILDDGNRAARYLAAGMSASGAAPPAADATPTAQPAAARGWLARPLGR